MKDLFLSVVEISLSTSVVILGLLIFSRGLNKRYLAKWKYFIWIALALRLAVPVKFELPRKEIVFEVPAAMAAPIMTNTTPVTAFVPQVAQAPSLSALDVMAFIWLAGCIAFLLVHFGSYFVYRRHVLLSGERVRDHELLRLIRGLARDLGISYQIPVRVYAGASSPMVLGFFRPILVLPETDYREEELGFILRHELIHLKRHDLFFKFLFILANALHWFNPVIYFMQKEAVVDMELSCDETVVQGGGYDTRKAYTETLLSTLCRQYQKSTHLSTQFYGGKKVMKLRFTNLLSRGKKRNGLIVFLIVVAIIAVFGTIVGFTTGDPDDPDPTGTAIGKASRAFAEAFAMGDLRAMEYYLDDSYEGNKEIYPFPERAIAQNGYLFNLVEDMPKFGDISNKSIIWPSTFSKTVPVGSRYTVKVREGDKPDGDHLILSLVNREDGWKVRDYQFVRGVDSYLENVLLEEPEEVSADERQEMDRIEKLLLENGLEYYAYMILEDASEELKPVILEARHRIILNSDWVDDGQDAWISDEEGNRIETVPHFSDVFPEDWEIPVESMTEEEQLEHSRLQKLIDPDRVELLAMFQAAMDFTKAYIGGDLKAVESSLAYSYLEPSVYEGPEIKLGDMTGKISFSPTPYDLSTNINDDLSIFSKYIPQGSRMTMSVDLSDFGASAGLERFVVTLAKMEAGWKIADYGFARRGITATEEDSRQIAEITEQFTAAYFAGDDKALDAYVLQPRDQFSSGAYTGELLEIHAYKGLPRAGDTLPENGQLPVSVEFWEKESPDSYTYLSMEFVKQGTEWKVYSYGLEK